MMQKKTYLRFIKMKEEKTLAGAAMNQLTHLQGVVSNTSVSN